MSNEQMPQGALSQEEMEALAKEAIKSRQNGEEIPNVINDVPTPSIPLPNTGGGKISANAETVRLPSMEDLKTVDREQLELKSSEVIHQDVKVGEPDLNYKPTTKIDDSTSFDIGNTPTPQPKQTSVENQQGVQQESVPNSGLVIENKQKQQMTPPIQGLSRDTQNHLESYLDSMETDMKETKAMRDTFSEFNPNLAPTETPQSNDTPQLRTSENDEDESERLKKYKEAIVVIDKLESRNLEFTKEEREKLDVADVIKLKEVKTVDLKQISRRRERRTDVKKALQRRGNSMKVTNIVLPASGYYAEMLGCSPYEIMTLQSEEDPITDNQIKWKLIYDKIKWNSIGFKTYEEFISKTAVADYETFIWGILRSTFEDEDRISLNCLNPECTTRKGERTSYEHKYSVLGLLRAEEISPRINENIRRIVDAKTIDEAKDAHNHAPVNDVLAFQLVESGFIVELCVNNVNDFINKTLDYLSDEELEPQYRQAAIIATAVKEIGIQADDGKYDFFDEPEDITEIIYQLPTNDLVILAHKVQDHTADVSFKFGFIDLVCPKCKTRTEFQPMQVDSILFYRNNLSMNVSVE